VPYEGELVSRSSVSLVLGALIAAVVVFIYYRKPDVRQWADEVAEQLSKVKWPTRKDVGNNTIVTIAVGAVLAAYLTILDRFWGFLTNLFYSSGL
jgi:preprotein translocase subunit SecE